MAVKAWPERGKIIYISGFDIHYVTKTLGYFTRFFYSELTLWDLMNIM